MHFRKFEEEGVGKTGGCSTTPPGRPPNAHDELGPLRVDAVLLAQALDDGDGGALQQRHVHVGRRAHLLRQLRVVRAE